MGQVVQLPQLKAELAKRRTQSSQRPLQVVFTNGCFDILHVGHTRYLQDAKALGDLLIVGLNADASVRRLKGDQRPVQAEEDRAEILAALGCVDYVVLFHADTPATLIEEISPDILVKGGDWPVEKIEGAKFVIAKGGQVKSLPFHPGRSTTNLIKRIEGR